MRTRIVIALLALVGLFLACLVPTPDEVYGSGKKSCDETHLCIDGYECRQGVCVEKDPPPSPDAGGNDPECTGDAGVSVGSHTFCVGDQQVQCQNRRKVVLNDCAQTGTGCDPTRGCLPRCSSGCPSGTECDPASDLCVAAPACTSGSDAGCSSGQTCTSGACLTHPSTGAFIIPVDTHVEAAIGCFERPPDAVSGTVTIKGRIRTAWNGKLGIGDGTLVATIKVFRASSFESDSNPIPNPSESWATTAPIAAYVAPPGEPADTTTFTGLTIPADTALVALVEGPQGSGLAPTYQYFRVPATAGESFELVLFAYDRKTWNDLASQAEVLPRAGRALISGTVRDCTSTTQSARGVAAGLTAASLGAFYTYPDDHSSCPAGGDWFECLANFPLIDLSAKVTGKSGRFFFFDVPALKAQVILDPGGEELPVALPVRAVPDSVTLLNMKSGGF